MTLRLYQQQAHDAVLAAWAAGHRSTLGVAATGAGKTQIFLSLLMRQLDARPARALILAHRKELIEQPLARIGTMDREWLWRGRGPGPRVGVVMADRDDAGAELVVATVQTLASEKRLRRLLDAGPIDYVVTDEAHHAVADSYKRIVGELQSANPDLYHLGVTATPIRADEAGLSEVFGHVSFKVTIAELVKLGWLVKPRWLGISTEMDLSGVGSRSGDYIQSQLSERTDTPQMRQIIVEAYQRYAPGRRAIAFTASVLGADELAASFRAAGISAAFVSGQTPKPERERILTDFRNGHIQVLANCQVLTEGFDAPGTACVLMCRPTRSDSLYIQCMGRGLRPAAGKAAEGEDCLILDFLPKSTRNIVMAGDVLGLPREVTDEALKAERDVEPGEAQLGWTFDGEDFNASGTPLEIIARQLDYLNLSPFVWHRYDGWMTLPLGKGADNVERLLAVPPGPPWRLYGLWKRDGERQWSRKLIIDGDIDACMTEADIIAARRAVGTLATKGRGWRSGPASEPQIKYLTRISDLRGPQLKSLSKGEAAALISHYQAVGALSAVVGVEVAA